MRSLGARLSRIEASHIVVRLLRRRGKRAGLAGFVRAPNPLERLADVGLVTRRVAEGRVENPLHGSTSWTSGCAQASLVKAAAEMETGSLAGKVASRAQSSRRSIASFGSWAMVPMMGPACD